MATNTPTGPGRQLELQTVHTLRKRVAFNDTSFSGVVGHLPPGAIITRGETLVVTAFNFGTNNLLDVGVTGTVDALNSATSLASADEVAFDDLDHTNRYYPTGTTVTYAMDLTGTAASTGLAFIVIEYIVDNDQ